jgi:coenzyme F420-reducing hydrogenase delta subunit
MANVRTPKEKSNWVPWLATREKQQKDEFSSRGGSRPLKALCWSLTTTSKVVHFNFVSVLICCYFYIYSKLLLPPHHRTSYHKMETILVVGASGRIGVSVIIAALRSQRNVVAIVRNKTAAEKIFHHVGTKRGITVVEADVTSENGVEKVMDQVRTGNLPPFQHVYSAGTYLRPFDSVSSNSHNAKSEE